MSVRCIIVLAVVNYSLIYFTLPPFWTTPPPFHCVPRWLQPSRWQKCIHHENPEEMRKRKQNNASSCHMVPPQSGLMIWGWKCLTPFPFVWFTPQRESPVSKTIVFRANLYVTKKNLNIVVLRILSIKLQFEFVCLCFQKSAPSTIVNTADRHVCRVDSPVVNVWWY